MDRQRNGWDFVIDVMNGMGRGLFASLIVGLILRQAGAYLRSEEHTSELQSQY